MTENLVLHLVVSPQPGQAVWVHDAEDFALCILPADVVLVPAVWQKLVDVVPQQPAVWGTTQEMLLMLCITEYWTYHPSVSKGCVFSYGWSDISLIFLENTCFKIKKTSCGPCLSHLLSVRWVFVAPLVETQAWWRGSCRAPLPAVAIGAAAAAAGWVVSDGGDCELSPRARFQVSPEMRSHHGCVWSPWRHPHHSCLGWGARGSWWCWAWVGWCVERLPLAHQGCPGTALLWV